MKKIFNIIYSLFSSIFTFLIYTYRFCLRGTLRPNLTKKITGEEVVVLCNGPSLKDEISNLLKSKNIYAVVNFFAIGEYYQLIQPSYYILSDGFFYARKKLPKKALDLYDYIDKQTKWNMFLYVPYWSNQNVNWQKIIKNPLVKVCFYNDIPYTGKYAQPYLKKILYTRGYANVEIWNVAQAATMLMVLLGYKKVYLYGVENNDILSINVNKNNQVGYIHNCFYDNYQTSFKLILDGNGLPRNMAQVLYIYYKTFSGYYDIEEFAKIKKSMIINCTENSLIDAFKRK